MVRGDWDAGRRLFKSFSTGLSGVCTWTEGTASSGAGDGKPVNVSTGGIAGACLALDFGIATAIVFPVLSWAEINGASDFGHCGQS